MWSEITFHILYVPVLFFACCFYNFSVFISERASRSEALGKAPCMEWDGAATGRLGAGGRPWWKSVLRGPSGECDKGHFSFSKLFVC